MSTERDFDQIARAWLDLMPDEAPDRTIRAVLEAVGSTPQAIRPAALPRRIRTMNRFVSAGIAAAVLVAAGTFLVVTRPTTPGVGGPSPSPAPSAGASATASATLADQLRATWIANASENTALGSGSGPVSMVVGSAGTTISASNFGPGLGFASSATATGPNDIELVLDRASADCPAGARGTYGWRLNDERSQLTLTAKSEACPDRGLVFARSWARSLTGATTVGAGVIDSMDPDFAVKLPDDDYQARTLDDFFEIAGSKGLSLMVFKNPQAFVDACSTDEARVPYRPGAEAFVDAFRGNDAFTVGASAPLKVDGHDAISVVVGAQAEYARCPGRELYQYTPRNCNCHFVAGPGGTDRWYLVEIGSDTFMFMVSPFGSAAEADVIGSIRIPFAVPSQ